MADSASTEQQKSAGESAAITRRIKDLSKRREFGVFVVAAALVAYFWATNSAFVSHNNLLTITHTLAPTAIIAAGEVMVMVLGEIDLSVGSVFGFAPAIMYLAYEDLRLILPLAVVVALLVCVLVGLVNGAVRVYFGVPSFVVTLGTFFLLGGLTVLLLNGFPKNAPEGFFRAALGSYQYSQILWILVVFFFMHLLLKHTRWGLHTFSAGGNFVGSREAGIRVDKIRIVNFTMAATLAGFAGILEAFRIGSIDPLSGGATTMFLAISAAVIGGTPLAGGVGTMIGALLGALSLSILRNGFTLNGVSANTFDVILGIAILVLMLLNTSIGRIRGARRVSG